MAAQYGNPSYWEERYKRDQEFYDWYQRWSGLKDALNDQLRKPDRILVIGLSEDLYEDGYTHQVNIDISVTAIEAMKEHYKSKPSMEFRVMNVLDMKEFNRGSFDVVMDKGTLDSIVCGESSTTNALTMLKEVSRILRPKGRYICITFGEPSFRITYLDVGRAIFTKQNVVKEGKEVYFGSSVGLGIEHGATESVHYIYICTKGEGVDT